ncbi:MAG: deoxyribose-phosphate aldolase [Firmicutes bacterium]|nr:deoxyribose-phosphate aldolase [Bacillota bacterium]
MNVKKILAACDHTLLAQGATWDEIRALMDDAIRYGCASVCIPPCFVKQATDYAAAVAKKTGGRRLPVCTVIGFPNGYNTTAVKLFETREALENGADEIDMVINIGWVKAGRDDDLLAEIRALKEACGDKILKVIIETCLLTEEEKIRLCRIVTEAGADFIKTSTGFSTGGATLDDVKLMRKNVGKAVKVKAAGGIPDVRAAEEFMKAGADRLGTSRVVKAVKAAEQVK